MDWSRAYPIGLILYFIVLWKTLFIRMIGSVMERRN